MIFLYGDSHASFSFKNLPIPYKDYHQPSVTMFRIGRDNIIINFNASEHDYSSILCFVYGEVDCRCHIQRQINLGRNEDDVINELVETYIRTIKNNIKNYRNIVIVGVIPPTKKEEHEKINGPVKHDFPFVGSDGDRVRFTRKVNKTLEEQCFINRFVYFNPYDYYTRDDGTLKREMADIKVHLLKNAYFIESFVDLLMRL
jgi:hypothetical protein